LVIDIVRANEFGPVPSQSLGRVTVSAFDLPSVAPGWVTLDFAPFAIDVVAGQTLAILLSTDSLGASFNWYADYTVYPWAMSWVSSTCCAFSGNSGVTFGFQTAVDPDPAAPVPEPTSLWLASSGLLGLGLSR
jgi:PEP-CTERM motif